MGRFAIFCDGNDARDVSIWALPPGLCRQGHTNGTKIPKPFKRLDQQCIIHQCIKSHQNMVHGIATVEALKATQGRKPQCFEDGKYYPMVPSESSRTPCRVFKLVLGSSNVFRRSCASWSQ
jgi:hypothetical protein